MSQAGPLGLASARRFRASSVSSASRLALQLLWRLALTWLTTNRSGSESGYHRPAARFAGGELGAWLGTFDGHGQLLGNRQRLASDLMPLAFATRVSSGPPSIDRHTTTSRRITSRSVVGAGCARTDTLYRRSRVN